MSRIRGFSSRLPLCSCACPFSAASCNTCCTSCLTCRPVNRKKRNVHPIRPDGSLTQLIQSQPVKVRRLPIRQAMHDTEALPVRIALPQPMQHRITPGGLLHQRAGQDGVRELLTYPLTHHPFAQHHQRSLNRNPHRLAPACQLLHQKQIVCGRPGFAPAGLIKKHRHRLRPAGKFNHRRHRFAHAMPEQHPQLLFLPSALQSGQLRCIQLTKPANHRFAPRWIRYRFPPRLRSVSSHVSR